MTDPTLSVGAELPPMVQHTSITQVFRYSAATWNTHRIHYDKAYAIKEGYPDVLVQSHLHGAFLTRYCTELVGRAGRLLQLSLRMRRFAVAGEDLTVTATVTTIERVADGGTPDVQAADVQDADGRVVVGLELTETRGSDGETCATGAAKVEVPASWVSEELIGRDA